MSATLLRTPLYERHVALGARMVPFAGWEMPVQYEGVIPEHRAVRGGVGVFDVSHMGELEVEGPRALELLQSLVSSDLEKIEPGHAKYTLLTNERGGIVDDLIAYRLDPFRWLLVVNASNRDADHAWLKEREISGSDVRDVSDEYALLAVQGPRALERLGLGARDTLRLEACYALHGNDITPDTDAISAGLGWTCALDKEFTGVDELRRIKADGPERKLVAFTMEERAIPRQGMSIEGGGEVTSGTHSPTLDVGLGMGYVPAAQAAVGTELGIDVRG
jgi:glycine cleavage system aminomethyltransferase T